MAAITPQGKIQSTKRGPVWLGIAASFLLTILVIVGSRNLEHYDSALFGYTVASIVALGAIVFRYALWLQRPATRVYWKRGWKLYLQREEFLRNTASAAKTFTTNLVAQRFIFRRGFSRWAMHFFIMWGCILAFAITFPLVFGWIHFETLPGDISSYRTFVFGFGTTSFKIHSLIAFLIFHGLVWSAFLVIAGVMLAMRRRMRDHGAAAVQRYAEDFLPLILLFAISITGLLLTASYTWMQGYGYDFLALLHAITVIFTLLYLPFGKFFHIFQRPAQLGVSFYKDVAAKEGMAKCARCDQEYAPLMQISDLIEVERKLGYHYELPATGNRQTFTHYQQICPACRRSLLALAQGNLWNGDTAQI